MHGTLESFLKEQKCRNSFNKFRSRAEKAIVQTGPRVFVVMPIQGSRGGTQEDKRVFKEYNSRLEAISQVLTESYRATAIRIDQEYPLEEMVAAIKREIDRAIFVIADLTDKRPSCYFEAGYATAKGSPILYIASKDSVLKPGQKTKVHFDIHNHVSFFTDHDELKYELSAKIDKHRDRLFPGVQSSVLLR